MVGLLTFGAIVGWAILVFLFMLTHAQERTMTEIIRDVESSR